eukprot:79660_1
MGNGFTKLIQDTESLFIAEKEFKCNTENKESSLCCEQIIATLVGVKLKARENQFAKGWKIILTENGPNTIESNEFVSSLNFLKPNVPTLKKNFYIQMNYTHLLSIFPHVSVLPKI